MVNGKVTLAGARVSAGLTQGELAEKLHVTRESVHKWETGKTKISFPTLIVFATTCGFSVDDIKQ